MNRQTQLHGWTPESPSLKQADALSPFWRPERRVIQKRLVDKLAIAMLEGQFVAGDTVLVAASDGELLLSKAKAGSASKAKAKAAA